MATKTVDEWVDIICNHWEEKIEYYSRSGVEWKAEDARDEMRYHLKYLAEDGVEDFERRYGSSYFS